MTTQSLNKTPARMARLSRAAERGMTLIEIMIVVSIIAMVAAGVAVVAIPKMKEAQIKAAETGARTIRNAVSQWQLANLLTQT